MRDLRRLPLPISSGSYILPGQTAEFVARSQLEDFWPERVLIKDAEHWIVEDLEIDGRSLLTGPRTRDRRAGPARLGCSFDPLSVEPVLQVGRVPQGGTFSITAKRVGPPMGGAPFEGCVFGSTRPPEHRLYPSTATRTEDMLTVDSRSRPMSSPGRLAPEDTRLPLATRVHEFWPERLVIKNPSDWVVEDLIVNKRSRMVQSGSLPGVMFSSDANQLLDVGPLSPADEFTVVALYVGEPSSEVVLEYSLSGPRYPSGVPRDHLLLLPMSTGVNILPNTSAQITSRVRDHVGVGSGFRARRIVIERGQDWVVNDVKVRVSSQFAQSGDVPGVAFSPDTTGNLVLLDPAPVGIDFVMVVTYVGDREDGARFLCGVAGDVVEL